MTHPLIAALLGVGVVLVATRRSGRVAGRLRLPERPDTFATPAEWQEWDDTPSARIEPVRTSSDLPNRQPAPAPAPARTGTGTAPTPPPTSPESDRRIATVQGALNHIHAYISSESGRVLHPQIAVTGRFDTNTWRSWNMLCQTAWGLRYARGCLPFFGPSYPLATAYAPYAVQQRYWTDRAAFEQAVMSDVKITQSGEQMSVHQWLVRLLMNRTNDNKRMHLDALSAYWRKASQSTMFCWSYT
jgi:hypothetical protein